MKKTEFRNLQKMRLLKHKKQNFKQDFKIFQECLKIIKLLKPKNILIFIPLDYEPNFLKFRHILNKNYKLFVPFMQDKSLKIVKLRLPFIKKRFGVLEPMNSFLKTKIDMAIVPVIGVDKNLKRIGHGKGFYDRFFENLNYKPHIIFVQSIDALSQYNLTQKHDISGKLYINPYKKYYKKERKNDRSTYRMYNRYNWTWCRIFHCKKNQ
ncbi:5-formyltetrahydrofolate cyclo-ligase [Campylobacter hepaticus]|uniref:5-formyltetrahydrofolate cyclo-ligase n=1 Tax=Campylobacter hepaticus TaxID=1813019 RepID=UPI0018CB2132|nr:5-formyltetrahydrofolate cyclo-ligase [Campylobacter hepaticus]MCZ0772142.1 5-formyltetrahydrofolate cyclo-ligase [Campylobacter hepaticus]MCZ0773611.1 5-formyltetrahydrofolate cyclo-ligase [Campylobacter hepaticus]MCZ0774861.1 5-formyltetrahydrofolate cyclo-ligase [Campylobacter hepaticus]QPM44143.1 5-formyltetrahydrofolate cyclo-ligase [Campylobacter hepaticus]WAP49065.1 5-formyltetrahydrofolate cyclo-ligase [Campylobacter hepaticus]